MKDKDSLHIKRLDELTADEGPLVEATSHLALESFIADLAVERGRQKPAAMAAELPPDVL